MNILHHSLLALTASLCANTLAAAEPIAAPRKEKLYAVTQSHRLISFSAGNPGLLLSDVALNGLAAGEQLLGIDYRVAKGDLFALGSSGRLFMVDVASGTLQPVGSTKLVPAPQGNRFGFDFNPAADRIRIVSDTRQNLRAHPDSGALVDAAPDIEGVQTDGALGYADGDPNASKTPQVVAAGYTYNKENEKLTTNFAIDAAAGVLVRQGSIEGEQPVVSPNTGKLRTVGTLGVADITDAHFDIADLNNAAFAWISMVQGTSTTAQLYLIDLKTGAARPLGKVGSDESLRGIAIQP